MEAPALERDLVAALLPEYLERVLHRHRQESFYPDELARKVSSEIRSDTGTQAHVSSQSIGNYLQHHADDLDFLERTAVDRGYVYSYSPTDK